MLILFSTFPTFFAIALLTYYYHNRSTSSSSLPDSNLSHDTDSLYYKLSDSMLFLCVMSLIPGIIALVLVNWSRNRRNDQRNKFATKIYVGSLIFLILFILGFGGKALTYFFD